MAYFLQKIIDEKRNYKIHDAKLLVIIERFYYWHYYFEQPYYIMEVFTNYKNLYTIISIYKLTRRKVQQAFNLSVLNFRLVYCKRPLNFTVVFSRQLDYQKNANLKNLINNNTLAFSMMPFLIVVVIISEPRLFIKKKPKQTLFIDISDSCFLNSKKQA